jgi:hypothetical protein
MVREEKQVIIVVGNSGVAKTYIKEITDVTNEAKGFSFISLVWGMGSIGN